MGDRCIAASLEQQCIFWDTETGKIGLTLIPDVSPSRRAWRATEESEWIAYTPDGGIISVAVTPAGDRIEIAVADTGVGIAAEDLPRIFDRFYRTDESRSRATGGFGLGLAISRDLVEAMTGTIEVASEPGLGSRFTVRLRAHQPEVAR